MDPSNEYRSEIMLIVSEVQEFMETENNLEIGFYSEHFISERITFIVALEPNGR